MNNERATVRKVRVEMQRGVFLGILIELGGDSWGQNYVSPCYCSPVKQPDGTTERVVNGPEFGRTVSGLLKWAKACSLDDVPGVRVLVSRTAGGVSGIENFDTGEFFSFDSFFGSREAA